MLQLSPLMQAAVDAHTEAEGAHALAEVVEIYASDYEPDAANGFEPADAAKRYGSVEGFTFLGLAYEREYLKRGDVQKYAGKQENTVSLTFSNASRDFAAWITSGFVEGMQLVVRVVMADGSGTLADSVVLFAGKLEKPADFDDLSGGLTATQRFGTLNLQIPPRTFGPNDPKNRAPSDPLFEGFRFAPVSGSLTYHTRVRRSGFGGLVGLTKKVTHSLQYSSHANFEAHMAVPDGFGRIQLPHVFLGTIDIGGAINVLLAFIEGPIDEFAQIRQVNPKFSQISANPAKRYGYLGGQGPSGRVQQPVGVERPELAGRIPGDGYYSRTAWIAGSVVGSTPEVDEAEAPDFAAVIKAKLIPLPDASGVFDQSSPAWSHNPAYIARFILADERYFNEGYGAVEDAVAWDTGLHCQEAVLDLSRGEMAFVQQADAGRVQRLHSTGLINPARLRRLEIGDLAGDPFLEPFDPDPFDPTDPPVDPEPATHLRERYTTNVSVTERQSAVDFLYDVLAPTGRLFFRRNQKGKIEILSERAADSSLVRTAAAPGASTLAVTDVTPWTVGPRLLQGKVVVGAPLTTSEVRKVTAASYTADANAVTLSASGSGGVTATASGATLAGGSAGVRASGTVTLTGSATGSVTLTVGGVSAVYALGASETLSSAAGMLSKLVNATPALKHLVRAEWTPGDAFLTLRSTWGVLTLERPLLLPHGARVAPPTAAPTFGSPGSGGHLATGAYRMAYAYRTATGTTVPGPTASVTVTAGQHVVASVPGALPSGVLSVDWYASKYAGSAELVLVEEGGGTSHDLGALTAPDSSAPLAPDLDGSGEEVLRIAASFSLNDQDKFDVWRPSATYVLNDYVKPTTPNGHKYRVTAGGTSGASEPVWPTSAGSTVTSGSVTFAEDGPTVLEQSGLLRANVHKGTFKWPIGSRQATVNQVKGTFYDATDDFAPTPLEVNDFAHQSRIRKVNSKEIDLSGFDNYHQASRYCNFILSKNREGDWFNELRTGPEGLVLEEGDLLTASADSGGLVNVVTRAEEISIGPAPFFTTRVLGRRYSTLMFSDNVRQHSLRLPTVLRTLTPIPTVFHLLDMPPFRPEDGTVPGFYILASFDEDTQGSWKGWALWADFGSGPQKLAEGNVAATLGETHSTATAYTGLGFDTSTVLTVRLKNGTLSDATQEEVIADGRRNLAVWGEEYVQFCDVTLIDEALREYEVRTFFRGRYGTAPQAHSAGERFGLMEAATHVPLSVARLAAEFAYYAPTVDEDVADGSTRLLTWRGGTARPLAPSNATRHDDDAGNSLITFMLRRLLGHGLGGGQVGYDERDSDRAEVHVFAEPARTTLLRVLGPFQRGMTIPGQWRATSQTAQISGSSVTHNASVDDVPATAELVQGLDKPGTYFECTLEPPDFLNGTIYFDCLQPGLGLQGYRVEFGSPGPPQQIHIYRLDLAEAFTSTLVYTGLYTSGARLRVTASGSELRFHLDYVNAGSPPFYVGPGAPTFPVRVSARLLYSSIFGGTPATVGRAVIASNQMQTVYSAAQKLEDGLTLSGPIYAKIYQISPLVGRGYPAEVVLEV